MGNFTNIVVGCGLSGASIARLLADKGERVLVIDKRAHLAGNIYDYKDKNDIVIHKYGSHIFHTNNENVWKFLEKFTDFNTYMHRVVAVIDGIETTIPFNINTLYDVFPQTLAKRVEEKLLTNFEYNSKVPILEFQKQNDKDLKFLAEYIFEKVFLHYTEKQWGKNPNQISSAVTARVPVYISKDSRYFQDKYQGIPLNGYTKMVENMINHPNIVLRLNTDFKSLIQKNQKLINETRIFYTGSIDEFFDYKYGELPYRSVYFKFETHNREFYQNNAVVNYPCNYDFTRIHEYKYYLNDKSDKTVIAKEYSEDFENGKNERYYPIENPENIKLYRKYLKEAPKNVYFLGRLGDYKYYNMDKAVERAINLFEEMSCDKS